MAKKRKSLVRGKDYDGWAYRYPVKEGDPEEQWRFYSDFYEVKPLQGTRPWGFCGTLRGKWVKVKFVEVN